MIVFVFGSSNLGGAVWPELAIFYDFAVNLFSRVAQIFGDF